MLGIAAGIDYALFVVTRFRRELAGASGPVAAAAAAVATAGHAVLFAGATVVVAVLGLLFAGIPFVGVMGVAAALTVAVMVLAALTLLPALLGLLGHRVDRLRLPWPRRTRGTGWWARWGAHVGRRRTWYVLAGAGAAAAGWSVRLGCCWCWPHRCSPSGWERRTTSTSPRPGPNAGRTTRSPPSLVRAGMPRC